MNKSVLDDLLQKNLVSEIQYNRLEPIVSGRVISLFTELRLALYVGVLLFTTGVGILLYENIGEIGHIVSISGLVLMTFACFGYAFYKTPPYSMDRHPLPNAYFDYVVLLGCLLFVSVLGYLQFQYALFDERLELTTLVSAALFFYVAYRFDHLGVLSLAITALASFFGLTITPQKWYAGDLYEANTLPYAALLLGLGLTVIALVLERRKIKTHFTFTYLNFASLLFLGGALTKVLEGDTFYLLFLLILLIACAGLVTYGIRQRSFLFVLYASVAGYIGITYFLGETVFQLEPTLWFMYFFLSCGGLIFFIIRFRNFFKRSV